MEDTDKIRLIKCEIERWAGQQGHDQCWYYPDIFERIAAIVDAKIGGERNLPPIHEFLGRKGCRKYAMEVYNIGSEFPEYVI